MKPFPRTKRTAVKRLPKRAHYEREPVYEILDEGFVCHVGFVVNDQPVVIPTGYARDRDRLYIHGSQASRMMRALKNGIDVCVTVTLVDGLVLARSAFHHSMNYRSVVIFGRAEMVHDEAEKVAALRTLSEHMIRGRWDDVRPPTKPELKATTVLAVPLTEASAKIRTGPPLDDEADYDLPVWAGVIPLRLKAAAPIPDARMKHELSPPRYARNYRRHKG